MLEAGLGEDYFRLAVPFDTRCNLCKLYAVAQAPAMVAISAYNKLRREKNVDRLLEFIQAVKAENADKTPKKT